MKRSHGLTALAVLHHVTAVIALLVMLGHCLSPGEKSPLLTVLQLCAFAFFTIIVRRGWASIDGGSIGMNPGKAQGFLWIPFFNFYWVFPSLVSLASQTNAKADAEQNPAGRITRGFGLVIAILFSVTTLTAMASSQLPLFAWLNLVVYATYIGFAVTYIWQIKLAAEAFDAKAAPALREPTKMPTVGIAGIIYGCACAALLVFSLMDNLSMSPEVIEQRLKSKGYTVRIGDATMELEDLKRMKDVASTDETKVIYVSRGGKHLGMVFYTTIKTPDAADLIAQRYRTKATRAGNKVLFQASLEGPPVKIDMPIDEWLASF